MKKAVIMLILICSLVFSLNLKPYLDQNIIAYDNKTNTQFIYDVCEMYFNKTPNLIYKPKLSLVPGTLIGFNELKLKDRTIALPYNDMFHGYLLVGRIKSSDIIIFGGNLNIIKEYLKGNEHIKESISTYDNFKLIKLTVDREIPIVDDSFLNNVTRKDYKVYSLNDNLKFNVYNYPKFLYRIMFNKGLEVFIRDNNEYNQIVLENYDGKNVYISVSKNIPIFQYKQALLNCYYTGRFDLCSLKPLDKKTLSFLNDSKENGFLNIGSGTPKRDIYLLKNFALSLKGKNPVDTFYNIVYFFYKNDSNSSQIWGTVKVWNTTDFQTYWKDMGKSKVSTYSPYLNYKFKDFGWCRNFAEFVKTILVLNNIPSSQVFYWDHTQAAVYYNGHIYTDTFYEPYVSCLEIYTHNTRKSEEKKYESIFFGLEIVNKNITKDTTFNHVFVPPYVKGIFYQVLPIKIENRNVKNIVMENSYGIVKNSIKKVETERISQNKVVANISSIAIILNNVSNSSENKTKKLNLNTNNENEKSTLDQIKEKLNEFKDYLYKKFVDFMDWIMKKLGGIL